MATKKQKREAALARRKEFLEKERASGLAALEASRVRESKIMAHFATEAKALNEGMEASLKAEIIAMSERFGERVRIAEDSGLESARRLARAEWMKFLAGLTNSPHRSDAVFAYVDGYSGPDPSLEDPCPEWCIVHRTVGPSNPSVPCANKEP
jgi:hypothetical protein